MFKPLARFLLGIVPIKAIGCQFEGGGSEDPHAEGGENCRT